MPKIINDKQKETLINIVSKNEIPKLTLAIKHALEDRQDYPEIINEKIDVMELDNIHPMTDSYDYGNTGSTL